MSRDCRDTMMKYYWKPEKNGKHESRSKYTDTTELSGTSRYYQACYPKIKRGGLMKNVCS